MYRENRPAAEVVSAIEHFNREGDVDVIILGRGGGSLEDLACFNEEAVARAIYASAIPTVSGMGHEIDFTIADFVADVRAPTPTAAADMAVPDKRALVETLRALEQRLKASMRKRLEGSRLLLLREVVELKEKKDFINHYKMYLDDLSNTLQHAFAMLFQEQKARLQGCSSAVGRPEPRQYPEKGLQHHREKGHEKGGKRRGTGGERR